MCFFLHLAELGKAEGVCRGQSAALEHAGQQSMTCSACFLQLDLSALIKTALTRAVPACINKVALSQLPVRQHACRSCVRSPTPVHCEAGSRFSPRKRSSRQVGQLPVCPGWMEASPGPRSARQRRKAPTPRNFQSVAFPGTRGEDFRPDFVSQRPSGFISKGQVKLCLATEMVFRGLWRGS